MTKIGLKNEKVNSLNEILEMDKITKIALLKHHMELSCLLINDILEEEVRSLAGERYSHNKPNNNRYSRWGRNPGSVFIGEEKVRIDVPRVYDKERCRHISLETYEEMKNLEPDESRLINGVLYGLSMNDYQGTVRHFTDSMGLSRSKVSQRFIEESSKKLEEFSNRDISIYKFVSLFIDGKYLSKEQMVIVVGITDQGEKIALDFIQTHTENSKPIGELLHKLIERGLKYEEGLLCVIDGAKGLKKALEEVFGPYAIIQRCQWHKRENVKSYLSEENQKKFSSKISKAYSISQYQDAKNSLEQIAYELEKINVSAAKSMLEGMEETLTLHRLGLNVEFGKSFSTTNVIENVNSQIRKYLGRVKNWSSSNQRYRWMACALLEAEKRMRRVDNYKNLNILRKKIKEDVLNIMKCRDFEE
ncbi:MAG: transposase [Candidatus Hodarchaeota archaeon]